MIGLVQSRELAMGQFIPATKVKNHRDELIDLADVVQEGWLLVYFYPKACLLYTSPSPRDRQKSRMPSSA